MRNVRHRRLWLFVMFVQFCILFSVRSTDAEDADSPGAQSADSSGDATSSSDPSVASATQQAAAADDGPDGLILIVDCSKTMAAPALKNQAQWAVSHILDAAPDGLNPTPHTPNAVPNGIPTSVILFGHNPAVPKNHVEVVGNLCLSPLTWRTKASSRRAVAQAAPSANHVFLSGALNVAEEIVRSSNLERVAIVVITDGQSADEKLEHYITNYVEQRGILEIRVIGLGSADTSALSHLRHVFQGPQLSMGYARTPEELTDTLVPVVAALDDYRVAQVANCNAVVTNLTQTLAVSNHHLHHASKELNRSRQALAAEIEVKKGLQKSVTNFSSQLEALAQKAADDAKTAKATILEQENIATFREKQIEKLADEIKAVQTQLATVQASNATLKKSLVARTTQTQELQATLDKCRAEYCSLDALSKKLRDELCCCVDAKKCLELAFEECKKQLCIVSDQFNALTERHHHTVIELTQTKTELANTTLKLTATTGDLDHANSTLATTTDTLNTVQNKLSSVGTAYADDEKLLAAAQTRICGLEAALAAAQQAALGAAREMAAAKHDSPSTVINNPIVAESGAPGTAASSSAAADGSAAASPGDGQGGGGGGGGILGSILGIAGGILAM